MTLFQKKFANFIRSLRPSFLSSFIKFLFFRNRFPFSTENGTFFINPCENLGNTLVNDGVYERGMSQLIKHFAIQSSLFFDIGANEGYFSILGKINNKKLVVHSFEPQERLQSIIKKNCELNFVEIILHNIGLSDSTGESMIHLANSMNNGASSLNKKQGLFSAGKQKISTKTLDDFVEQNSINSIDFAKIDIEGHEFELLKGATKVIKNKIIKNIIIEFHPKVLSSQQINESQQCLIDSGYVKTVMFGVKYFTLS